MDPVKMQSGKQDESSEARYVAPEINSYSPQDFLEMLGPAQGYGGGGTPGRTVMGRGARLWPGLR